MKGILAKTEDLQKDAFLRRAIGVPVIERAPEPPVYGAVTIR